MFLVSGVFFAVGMFVLFAAIFFAKDKSAEKNCEVSKMILRTGIGAMIICTLASIGILFLLPNYYVWQQNKEGEAELAKAEQNRQIAVQEAKAKEESAKSLANAEIIRAEGVAKANKIIGDSLQNNEAYIHYL